MEPLEADGRSGPSGRSRTWRPHGRVENEAGERAYKVDGKAVRVRQTFVLEDASGNEVARIQERKLSIRDKVAIERDGDTLATIHKALVGIRDRFSIDVEDGDDMKAHGNVVDHEYEIERDGDTVAHDLQEVVPRARVLRRRRGGRRRHPAHPRDHRRHRLADLARLKRGRAGYDRASSPEKLPLPFGGAERQKEISMTDGTLFATRWCRRTRARWSARDSSKGTFMLARIAALAASVAPPASYLVNLEADLLRLGDDPGAGAGRPGGNRFGGRSEPS